MSCNTVQFKYMRNTQVLDNSFMCTSADSITGMAKILQKKNPDINDLWSRDTVHSIPCSDSSFCIHICISFELCKVPTSEINTSVGIAT